MKHSFASKILISLLATTFLTACGANISTALYQPPKNSVSKIATRLTSMPAPEQKITVAVYNFQDLTGQRRRNDDFAEMSSAVTQAPYTFFHCPHRSICRPHGRLEHIVVSENRKYSGHRANRYQLKRQYHSKREWKRIKYRIEKPFQRYI